MIIFCTERFKAEYKKLTKQNAYRDLQNELIDNFFYRSDDQISYGAKISGTNTKRLVKKRIAGRGGYRVYFYAYVLDNKVFLSYLYPKTGPVGKMAINDEFETLIMEETLEAIDSNDLFEVTVVDRRLNFTPTGSNSDALN
ncbi:MAG: hypothetical protein ABIN80_23885 [Dyadobacter sp.]|uniref:hypothetical protein n=1 Tax=Dyadobacter sp. TaxID=1914288 RepID=UPI00326763EF